MTLYHQMRKGEATAALEEFLRGRPPALQRLTELMAADGLDPAAVMDRTPDSLVSVWRWATSKLAARTPGSAEFDGRWVPSWLRHSFEDEPVLSYGSVLLLDGVVSYVCQVVEGAAPAAAWRLGFQQPKSYELRNHPVLGRGHTEFDVARRVSQKARGLLLGVDKDRDDDLALMALSMVSALRGEPQSWQQMSDERRSASEPMAEVTDLRDGQRAGDFDFAVDLDEEVAHEHSRMVDRLVRELRAVEGIEGVHREDRELLLVRAPTWDARRLTDWISGCLEQRLNR